MYQKPKKIKTDLQSNNYPTLQHYHHYFLILQLNMFFLVISIHALKTLT